MRTAENVFEVYLADYIEIQSKSGLLTGHFTDIKERFNITDHKLHETLSVYVEKELVKVKFKNS